MLRVKNVNRDARLFVIEGSDYNKFQSNYSCGDQWTHSPVEKKQNFQSQIK